MPVETVFRCDSVQFSSGEAPPTTSLEATLQSDLTDDNDRWSPAKVSLQDVGPNDRWLMIELEGSAASEPRVFRPIKGWVMSADERSMIVAMKGEEPGALTKTIQKLRFDRARSEDYWAFMHEIATARLQECFPQQ